MKRGVIRAFPKASKPGNYRLLQDIELHSCDSPEHIRACLACELPRCRGCFGNDFAKKPKKEKRNVHKL